jgi:hypothetical protein
MSRAVKLLLVTGLALLATVGWSAVASAATLHATLTGEAETPDADRDGAGTATITTNVRRGRVCFDISLRRVGTVLQGHIHAGGKRVANGNVVVPLFGEATRQPEGCVRDIPRATIRAINRNPRRFYVNVHNERFPAGAVRGQLHR